MADNKGEEQPASRGNEWEVVSLTASAYAASPGPGNVEASAEEKENIVQEEEAETSNPLFMSRHFVFPPNEHENLPFEPEAIKTQKEEKGEYDVSDLNVEEGSEYVTKAIEDWDIKGMNLPDELLGLEIIEEKGKNMSLVDTDFEASFHDKEHNLYDAANFSSIYSETTVGELTNYEMNLDIPVIMEHSVLGYDITADIPASPTVKKEEPRDGSDLPCEAWWKRQADSLYAHAKEANTFWSIFIAAAVMGIVIIGKHWQPEKWQKMGKMTGPITRLKDVIVGGHRRGSLIGGHSSGRL